MRIPTTRPETAPPRDSLRTACLLLVLGMAALTRFYGLETPSMWWDEIYTPMTSRYPVSYILAWCGGVEIQPPAFYLAMKAVMAMGHSDFALRLPFALAGLGAVLLTYQLGSLTLGVRVGLGAAALVAFNPMLLWLSRTLRVYPVLHLGLVASLLLFLLAFDRGERRRAEAGLYAVNLGLLLLHYSAVLMVGAEFATLLAWRLLPPRRGSWGRVARFGLVSLVSFLPSAPFFFSGMVAGHRLQTHSSLMVVLRRVLLLLGEDATYFNLAWTGTAFGLWAVWGGWLLWRRNRSAMLLLVCAASLPAAAVVAQRYDNHLFAYHLAFLTLPMAVLAATPLALTRRSAALAAVVLFAAVSVHWALGPAFDWFYAPDSYDNRIFRLGNFKHIAREAPRVVRESPVLCPDLNQYNAVNWYLERFASPNPLVLQRLDRQRTDTDLLFWCPFDNFGHLAKDRAAFRSRYPGVRTEPATSVMQAYRLRIARQPLVVDGKDATVLRLDAAPEHFYRDVATLSHVMIWPYFGDALIPTANETWGDFEYDIRNASADASPFVTVVARYANQGRENRVELEYRQDGGPWRRAFSSLGPDATGQAMVRLDMDGPWRKLTVRGRLWCAPLTPVSGGSNLSSVRFHGLDVYVCGRDKAEECAARLAMDQLPQGFPATEGPGQTLELSNLAFHEAPEVPGWGYYTPRDPARPGEIRVTSQVTDGPSVFYPRVSGEQSVASVTAGGAVYSLRGMPKDWTPMGMAVPLPGADASVDARFRLEGPFAQLWTREGRVIFSLSRTKERAHGQGK